MYIFFFFFFQAEDGIRDLTVTGVQTCALPIYLLSAGGGVGSRGLDSSVGLDRHGLSSCWLGHANVMRRGSARRGSASNSFGPGCRRVGETYPTIVSCRPTPPSPGLRQ